METQYPRYVPICSGGPNFRLRGAVRGLYRGLILVCHSGRFGMILSKNHMVFLPTFFKIPSHLQTPSNNRSNLETKRRNGKKPIIYGQNLAFPAIAWSFVSVASTASTEASEKAFRQPNTVRNFQEIFFVINVIRKKYEMTFNMMMI